MVIVEKYHSEYVTRILDNEAGVEVIHIPTGLCATCNIYKSNFKNGRESKLAIKERLRKGGIAP